MPFIYGFLIGFAVVAGWAILRWRLRGRDPVVADDESILLGEPPEGLTPAVAALITGLPPATAFSAALFDLASRGEISFRDETPEAAHPHKIGIEVHASAADTADPAIARNRRRPIGPGEAWLLNGLRNFADEGDEAFVLSPNQRTMIEAVVTVMQLANEARDQEGGAGATNAAPAPDPEPAEPPKERYIKASAARRFQAPRGFITLLESDARQRGWLVDLSIAARWRWRGLAIGEFAGGLALQVVGMLADSVLVIGLGVGVMAGGIATWFVASSMATRTREGALVRAEVAAYRRTLGGIFNSSATLDDALRGSPLKWLDTPDQMMVWGVALWLQPEIMALLERSAAAAPAGQAGPGHVRLAMSSPLVFAGIENIGSESPEVRAMLGPVANWIAPRE